MSVMEVLGGINSAVMEKDLCKLRIPTVPMFTFPLWQGEESEAQTRR